MSLDSIARYMEDYICGQCGVPGCDLVVSQNHKPVYRHTCGVADRETGIPLGSNQLYYLYSTTKPITVTAGLRLVEEGKLLLDAPVGDYLPAFRSLFLLKDGVKVPTSQVLTVRNLFTMTGGFDYTLHTEDTDAVIRETGGQASTRQIVDTFALRAVCFEPGFQFQYSLCLDILGAVIEAASGMQLSEYMAKIIFQPLGMTETSFRENEEVHKRLAQQYIYQDGQLVLFGKQNNFRLSENYESGGAGLISCVEDYIKFADTLACGGTSEDGYRLLKPETVELLRSEQLASIVMNNDYSCGAGNDYGYGLGVRTKISKNSGRSPVGEFGWDGAAGCYVMMDPVNHLSIFFAMQVLGWPYCIGPAHGVLRDLVYEAYLGDSDQKID